MQSDKKESNIILIFKKLRFFNIFLIQIPRDFPGEFKFIVFLQ